MHVADLKKKKKKNFVYSLTWILSPCKQWQLMAILNRSVQNIFACFSYLIQIRKKMYICIYFLGTLHLSSHHSLETNKPCTRDECLIAQHSSITIVVETVEWVYVNTT